MAPSKRDGVEAGPKQPCPQCGRARQCLLKPDGAVFCYKIDSGLEREDKQGNIYYIHRPSCFGNEKALPVYESCSVVQGPARATDDQLNRFYLEMQCQLGPLKSEHNQDLMTRGLSGRSIQMFGFRSVNPPRVMDVIATSLVEKFSYWENVPGLVLKNGRPHLRAYSGMLIFSRDLEGRIFGAQIRADDASLAKRREKDPESPRYLWLSSNPDGPSAKAGPAWWGPLVVKPEVIRITEGCLKSAVTFDKTGIPSISAGTGVGSMSSEAVLDWIKRISPRRVLVAPDMDAFEKPVVARQIRNVLRRLSDLCGPLGIELKVEVW